MQTPCLAVFVYACVHDVCMCTFMSVMVIRPVVRTCMSTQTHNHVYICTSACTSTCVHWKYTHAYTTHTCIRAHTRTCTHTCTHTCIHTRTHTCTHSVTHTHIHMYTQIIPQQTKQFAFNTILCPLLEKTYETNLQHPLQMCGLHRPLATSTVSPATHTGSQQCLY